MFPWRSVVLPWLVARLLVVPVMVLASPPESTLRIGNLISMDGQWFRLIALDWYDRPYVHGGFSEYPFFPLFPAAGGALMQLGVPSTAALAGLSWIASLLVLAGARQLAVRHLDARAADLAPWVMALAPGGLSMILGYSDAFYLAGLIWALVAVERRHWWLAGTLAAVATASRPNGVIAVAAVVVVAFGMRASARQVIALVAPSALVLVGWMAYLNWATGDPLVFWTAKTGWEEMTLVEFVTDPLYQPLAVFHVVTFVVFVVPYLMRFRSQPPAWGVVVVLTVAPPLALGVIGLARYSILAFPMAFATADVLARQRPWVRILGLVVGAIALVALARLVVIRSWVP